MKTHDLLTHQNQLHLILKLNSLFYIELLIIS